MKVKKNSPLALLLMVLVLLLSACGGGSSAPAGDTSSGSTSSGETASGGAAAPEAEATAEPAEEAPAVQQPDEITFAEDPQPGQKVVVWMVRTGLAENAWERDVVIPAYQKARPDVFLKVLNIRQEDIAVKREAMIAAKEPLHVWSPNWGGDGFASDRYRGLLQDLTPLIERDKLDLSDFLPDVLSIYQSEGKQWGIPFLVTGTYVYYNKELFDEAGVPYPPTDWDDETWTWERYIEVAKQLTKNYDDPNTAIYGTAGGYNEYLEGYPGMWGKNVWTKEAFETGFSDNIVLTDEASITAFQAFHDRTYVHKVSPDPATTSALDQLGGAFQTGRVAMFISGGWGHWNFTSLIDDPNGFCWGTAPLPKGAPNADDRSINYADPWVITAGLEGEELDEAWEFLKFLTSAEQQKLYTETSGTPPVRASLLENYFDRFSKCQDVDAAREAFQGAFSHGHESANHLLVKYDELQQSWQNILTPFWSDPEGKASEVLPEVEAAVNDALQRIRDELKP
jgi:multiple sugar transport system substrate-binding protein